MLCICIFYSSFFVRTVEQIRTAKTVERLFIMRSINNNAKIGVLAALSGVLLGSLFFIPQRDALLPTPDSAFPYAIFTSTDNYEGGNSQIAQADTQQELAYSFNLQEGAPYPYTSITLGFGEDLIDLSPYNTLELTVECSPANVLLLTLHTFDPAVTQADDFLSYRRARTSFPCAPETQRVAIDLEQLNIPEWWLLKYQLPLTQKHYDLSKVFELAFENSLQSPHNIQSEVKISQIALTGPNWTYRIIAIALFATLLLAFIRISYKRFSQKALTASVLPDHEEVVTSNYQPVTTDSKSDRERAAVLDFMATSYSNPELNLELITQTLGINRIKVNDILRDHYGVTFSGCLKKIRLTEAARLLREKEASIAEIGYMVGYNNASYFNQQFKKEYGCTPNTYRKNQAEELHQ